jgi:hypothetical protein
MREAAEADVGDLLSATFAEVATIAMRFIFAGCCAIAAGIVGASIRSAMNSRRLIDRILRTKRRAGAEGNPILLRLLSSAGGNCEN